MLLPDDGRVPLVTACAAVWAAPAMASAGLAGAVTTGAAPPTRLLKLNWPSLPRITRAFRPLMATWSTTKLLDSSGHTATARRVLSIDAKVSLLPASDSDTPCTARPMRGNSELDLAVDGQGAVIAFLDKLFQLVLVRIGIECQQEDGQANDGHDNQHYQAYQYALEPRFHCCPVGTSTGNPYDAALPRGFAGGRAAGVLKSICLRRQIPRRPDRGAAPEKKRA